MPGSETRESHICLLSGPPGCGKTTLINRFIRELRGLQPAGFFTEEIRESGKRQGFTATGFDGQTCVLAHRNIRSSQRIGAYGVDIAAFESTIVANLEANARSSDLLVIDELGKMELLSPSFRHVVQRLIDGDRPILATIPIAPLPFIRKLLARPDVLTIRMNTARRSTAAKFVAQWCKRHNLGTSEELAWATSYH